MRKDMNPATDLDHKFAGRTVLLAEDEHPIRKLLTTVLTAAGFEVLPVADGHEALERSRNHSGPIDLLITNVRMPRLGGLELADHIARERPETKTIVISGFTSGKLADLSNRADFLQKPFLPKVLLEKIAVTLDAGIKGPTEV
jgi:two-component system cell cycle sensor histidine kinase/response regulator CckA